MPLLSLSNIDIEFAELKKFTWKTYIVAKALLTTSWVKLIRKKKFAKTALDKNSETFAMYVLASEAIKIYSFWAA